LLLGSDWISSILIGKGGDIVDDTTQDSTVDQADGATTDSPDEVAGETANAEEAEVEEDAAADAEEQPGWLNGTDIDDDEPDSETGSESEAGV
jgi:hypothetical protein